MTKEVLISIRGVQIGDETAPVAIKVPGTYHYTNGKHFIQYDERSEDSDDIWKNIIKISSDRIIISKKGNQSSQMAFVLNDTDQAVYQTPYGNFIFETNTKVLIVKEQESKIEIKMEYSLSTEGSKVSDNEILIAIDSI